jgi:hypothetical protein
MSEIEKENREPIKNVILREYKEGNIVFLTPEGIARVNFEEFIKQPVDGMLYDLNRNEATILTFIDDRKWINDYAMCKVVRKLKEKFDGASSNSVSLEFFNECFALLKKLHFNTAYRLSENDERTERPSSQLWDEVNAYIKKIEE